MFWIFVTFSGVGSGLLLFGYNRHNDFYTLIGGVLVAAALFLVVLGGYLIGVKPRSTLTMGYLDGADMAPLHSANV